jgi:hypothetical protein
MVETRPSAVKGDLKTYGGERDDSERPFVEPTSYSGDDKARVTANPATGWMVGKPEVAPQNFAGRVNF